MRPIHGEPLSVLLESKGAADAAPLYLLGSLVAGAGFEPATLFLTVPHLPGNEST